jgi:hypothetical protein
MSLNTVDEQHKTSAFGLLTLGTVLLLVVAALLFRPASPAVHPLTPAKKIVVLLVPGTSLADWRNRREMPALAAHRGFFGVFPNRLPWRVGSARLTPLSPASSIDFVRASNLLGGKPLGSALSDANITRISVGRDPGASAFLGLTTVPSTTSPALAYDNADAESLWRTAQPEAVGGFVTDPVRLAAAIRRAAAKSLPTPLLLTATFDDLLRCDTYAPLSRPTAAAAQRRAALRRLDTLLAQLMGAGPNGLPTGTGLLVVTPVSSTDAAERGELLGPVMLRQRSSLSGETGFLLTSPSTRYTPGLLAPGDLAATVLHLMGISEKSRGGRPAVVLETAAEPSAEARYLAERVSRWSAQAREIRFIATLPWLLTGTLLLAALFGRGKVRSACSVGASILPLALLLAALFASENKGEEAQVYVAAVLMTLAASAASVVLAKAKKREDITALLQAICVMTAGVIVFDTLTGGTLLARSPLSYSPVAAARFYGIGNEISGVFLGASILTVGALCPTPLGAVLGGLIVALISGMPMFGADAGGFLAALAGFGALFVLLTAERSGNQRRVAARALVGAGTVILLLLFLYVVGSGRQSPGTRSHVGEAVASAQSEGAANALLPVIQRKAATAVRLLFTSPWSILLITEVGICLWLRRRRSPGEEGSRAVFRAVFVSAGALLLVNDSGVVAAATCLLFPTCVLLLAEPPFTPPSNENKIRAADA